MQTSSRERQTEERQKMEFERLLFGRFLSVSTGESQEFWASLRPPHRHWWVRAFRRFNRWLDIQILKGNF